MNYRDEFGHYAPEEDRTPWELTPAQRWREHFSCTREEESWNADRCTVVEEQKAAHESAHAERAARQQAWKEQLEAKRRAMQAAGAQAVRSSTPEKPVSTPHSGSIVPPRTNTPRPSAAKPGKKSEGVSPIAVIVLLVMFLFAVIAVMDTVGVVQEMLHEITAEKGEDDDFFHFFEETPAEPEDYKPQREDYTLPPYLGKSDHVTVPLNTAEGKKTLTYQELYAQCRPAMVSIAVSAGNSGATGSGIILTEDGYIITCAHVVEDKARCSVTTHDEQTYEAKLVGMDTQTDLALLKIEAKGLTPAEFGNSEELTIGDEALAIGDPLGSSFRATLTNGIISGINRTISNRGYNSSLIQTTAAVNSGNSGGALLNIYGQVVGVVNLKMVTHNAGSATVEGMGMAVPTVTVKEIIETLAKDGSIVRPVLGITCTSITEETGAENNIPAGLMIQSMDDDSDCAAQGLELYDVITAADGVPVTTVEEFKAVLGDRTVGDTVTLTVWRDFDIEERMEEAETRYENGDDEPILYEYEELGDYEIQLIDARLVD